MYDVDDELSSAISRYAAILCGLTRVGESSLGGFVWTNDSYGIGKLVAIEGRKGRVSFFHSITEAEERCYPTSHLGRACLSPQTRVYVHDDEAGKWRAGRVLWHFKEDTQFWYEICFPNGQHTGVAETHLEVRCLRPKVDPTEVLAFAAMETQYFHDRRLVAIDALVKMRAASRGLTGLLSSSIELVPHQVEIVRRVLEDPIQRYMLADEVGLGKTIEAGAIIRQCLLDNPGECIIVIVPSPLVRQWQRELSEKFHINEFPDSVAVLPFEDLGSLEEGECDLLVIDEAHLLVGKEGTSQRDFNHLARIAHSSRRLLLLSATPVLGHHEATFALLHLLDPVTYRLEIREVFRERIERRQEYGQRLLALNPRLPPPILDNAVQQVSKTFPNDLIIAQLARELKQPEADVDQVIATLRRHIAETYRLHQRLLRTRRRDLDNRELLPRRSSLTIDIDDDIRIDSIWEGLENWWYASRRAVEMLNDQDGSAADKLETGLARRYAPLIEALGRGVGEFAVELERQQRAADRGELPTFVGEEEVLSHLVQAVRTEPELMEAANELTSFEGHHITANLRVTPRVTLAAASVTLMVRGLRAEKESPVKAVVFSSSTDVALNLHECLCVVNGNNTVFGVFEDMLPDDVDAAVRQFENSETDAVVVCDRSGELGLNFHFADGIIHLDLPLSPARLEQRIGRVDRFGRRQEIIRQRVIIPSDEDNSPWLAWYELLKDAFRLFDQSVSEVHFILDKLGQDIELALYRNGAAGIKDMKAQVCEELEQERQRLDEQYALDRLATDEQEAITLFTALKETDENESGLERTLNQWMSSVLQFSHWYTPHIAHDVFTYRWSDRTLAPEWPWRVFLADGLDQRQERRYLTYYRSVAMEHPEVALMRPGFSLIDRMRRFMIWDDRGSAFATWRMDPTWEVSERGEWMGFRLCYVIEADIDKIGETLIDQIEPHLVPSIRRRTDGFLHPCTEVLHVDLNLQEVVDTELLAILTRPYSRELDDAGRRDYNLGSRPAALFGLVDPQAFIELCRQVRKRSEEIIRNNPRFLERTQSSSQRTRRELKVRNERLRLRNEAIRHETGNSDPTIEMEIAINEAIITGVTLPRIRLDSIGFFIVADYPPDEVLSND